MFVRNDTVNGKYRHIITQYFHFSECPILNNPPNGIVSIDGGSTVGKNATYKCNYGYKLEGVESRTCQTNKTWAGEEPVCAEIGKYFTHLCLYDSSVLIFWMIPSVHLGY